MRCGPARPSHTTSIGAAPAPPSHEQTSPPSFDRCYPRCWQLFFGEKRWRVAPPRWAGITDLDPDAWPDAHASARLPRELPLRFTQRAGDVVLLPEQWGHSTYSVNFTLGLGMLWCGARLTNVTGSCHVPDTVYEEVKPSRKVK